MTWARRLYPLLFVIAPVLSLSARNPGRFLVRDAVVICVLAVLGTALVYALAYACLRLVRRPALASEARDAAALVTFAAVAAFWLYPFFRFVGRCASNPRACAYELFNDHPRASTMLRALKHWLLDHRAAAVAIGLVALALAALVLVRAGRPAARRARGLWARHHPSLAATNAFLTRAGVIATLFTVAQLGYLEVQRSRAIASSTLVRELERPLPVDTAALARARAAGEPKRDIYVLFLDAYPSSDVLREHYGVDNRPFEDSLRALGFKVPTVRSNYAVTLLSVNSFLNFEHVVPLLDVVRSKSMDYGPATYVMQHNRAARFLKSQGYRFVFFPSKAYAPTSRMALADEQFDAGKGLDLSRALYGSAIAMEVANSTLLAPARTLLRPYVNVLADFTLETIDGLAALPRSTQPTFVVAHVLQPHVPLTLDSACRALPAPTQRRELMAGELACLNRRTLHTIRALMARSAVKPIIIIQGDHGSQSLRQFDTPPAELTVEQARERFRPLGAYYLPDGGEAAIPDTVSIVNVMRYVLDHYFHARLEPVPNAMYFSSWRLPYWMIEVGEDFRAVPPVLRQGDRRVTTAVRRGS